MRVASTPRSRSAPALAIGARDRRPRQSTQVYDFSLYTPNYYAKGFLAGGVCCSVTHGGAVPIDVVKTRMQLESGACVERIPSTTTSRWGDAGRPGVIAATPRSRDARRAGTPAEPGRGLFAARADAARRRPALAELGMVGAARSIVKEGGVGDGAEIDASVGRTLAATRPLNPCDTPRRRRDQPPTRPLL